MMTGMMNCGWAMMAGGVVTLAVLGLGAAALVKYLFFAGHNASATL